MIGCIKSIESEDLVDEICKVWKHRPGFVLALEFWFLCTTVGIVPWLLNKEYSRSHYKKSS
ncbi:hypothetical protein [Candidatus Sordicultor fermentans]|uniref:hypothetical protein n=1 Tax=Candidatus Sordicultor fermentans TaxID=1953203 RepID=UPI001696A6B6|nr:hypothetical protein [Atribacterota bacterium]NLY05456.1 hypothetical protein [Candidatus Atribacteria bacterium]